MGNPAARKGDTVNGIDTHIVMMPSPMGEVPTPVPMAFQAKINAGTVDSVQIDSRPAAVVGAGSENSPPHAPSGGRFMKQPSNKGTITRGSDTVFIGGKPAARSGDAVLTCADPASLPNGTISSGSGTVFIG